MAKLDLENIQKRCAKMAELAAEREANEVVSLPIMSADKCSTPNSFLRSALFATIKGKDRIYLEKETLFSQNGITIKFTGKQLNQEDLSIWEAMVRLAGDTPLGTECRFSAYSILKELGLKTGGRDHQVLYDAIVRLNACSVQITHDKRTYFGSLVEEGAKDEETGQYVIRLNKKLIRLFGDNQWTGVHWNQRLSLRGKPLAQSLHGYYSSHREPVPVTLQFLQQLTGSKNKQLAGFKRYCRAALDTLVDIGFLRSYTITDNLVTVKPSLKDQINLSGSKAHTNGI